MTICAMPVIPMAMRFKNSCISAQKAAFSTQSTIFYAYYLGTVAWADPETCPIA